MGLIWEGCIQTSLWPNTDRFERKLRSNMDIVKKATDQMDGMVGRYELTRSEVNLGGQEMLWLK
jgi:hypothetical protein